jgi:enamine deaminase RidA (YjgF/YER057c/UK114 family)
MGRRQVSTGAKWEPIIGYSRLVRIDRHIYITGTAAVMPNGETPPTDAHAQAVQCLRNIEGALKQIGASLDDIVRTRIFVKDIRRDWEAIGKAHAELLGHVRPASTMVEVSRFIEDWILVEIEADAVVLPE